MEQERPAQEPAQQQQGDAGADFRPGAHAGAQTEHECLEHPGAAGKGTYPEQTGPEQATATPHTLPGLDRISFT